MTQHEYENCKKAIVDYEERNFRKPYESFDVISHVLLNKIKEIKHSADLTCGDIVWLTTRETSGNPWHERIYERVLCTGYCGRDEFWGETIKGNKRRAWTNGDSFKVVGIDANMKAEMAKQLIHDQIADNYKLK